MGSERSFPLLAGGLLWSALCRQLGVLLGRWGGRERGEEGCGNGEGSGGEGQRLGKSRERDGGRGGGGGPGGGEEGKKWRKRRTGRGRSEPCLGGPDPGGVLRGPSPSLGARCPHVIGVLNLCSRTLCSWSPCSVCAPVCWASEADAAACPGELSPALSRAPSHQAPCLPPGEPPKAPQPVSHEGLEQTAQARTEVLERTVPIR